MAINNIHLEKGEQYTNTQHERIDYIDLLKGFAILWIIWIHTTHPDFVGGPYRIPIFFFASGIFFKKRKFKEFFIKRLNTLIIPFLFFYLISYPFRIIVHFWDFRTLSNFNWLSILDLFKSVPQWDYLSVNVPLWFLLCIFVIQVIYYFLMNLPRYILIILIVLSILLKDEILSISTPFMINNALYWGAFFALGNIIGKPFIKLIKSLRPRITIFIICMGIFIGCHFFSTHSLFLENIITHIEIITFILSIIIIFSFFDGLKCMEFLRFYGKNSLIVLGSHLLILIPLDRISFKLFHIHTSLLGFTSALITTIILYFVINWMNKNLPYVVGKKPIFKTT